MATPERFDDTEVISREFIQYLSGEISKEWKELGRYLNLSDPKLDQIEADVQNNLKERIYQMLLFWKQSKGYKATYRTLNKALCDANRRDLVKDVDVAADVLLVGGVMIESNQLVTVFDERQNCGGVLLVCTDPDDNRKEYWRYLEPIAYNKFPVVMSSAGICCEDKQQLLFAIGLTLHVIHFKWEGSMSLTVQATSYMSIRDESGPRITSIAPSYEYCQPSDRCVVGVIGSNLIQEFRPSDFNVRKRETKGFPYFITSIACTNELLAMIGHDRSDVMLFSCDGKMTTYNLKSYGTSKLKPVWVIWNGSKWLVLFVGEETEIEWQVVSYVENGTFFKLCDKGRTHSQMEIPVSITAWDNTGFVIFANNIYRNFKI